MPTLSFYREKGLWSNPKSCITAVRSLGNCSVAWAFPPPLPIDSGTSVPQTSGSFSTEVWGGERRARSGPGGHPEATSTCFADHEHVSSVSCMPSIAELSQQWGTCIGPSNRCSWSNISLLVLPTLLLWLTVPLPSTPEPHFSPYHALGSEMTGATFTLTRRRQTWFQSLNWSCKTLGVNENLWTFPYGMTFFSPCALDKAGDRWLTIRAFNIKFVMTGNARSAFLKSQMPPRLVYFWVDDHVPRKQCQ